MMNHLYTDGIGLFQDDPPPLTGLENVLYNLRTILITRHKSYRSLQKADFKPVETISEILKQCISALHHHYRNTNWGRLSIIVHHSIIALGTCRTCQGMLVFWWHLSFNLSAIYSSSQKCNIYRMSAWGFQWFLFFWEEWLHHIHF